jgi:hypothetical protein
VLVGVKFYPTHRGDLLVLDDTRVSTGNFATATHSTFVGHNRFSQEAAVQKISFFSIIFLFSAHTFCQR